MSTALVPAPREPAGVVLYNREQRLALEPTGLDQALRVAEVIAKAGLYGIKTAGEAYMRMARGRELGLSAQQSLANIHVIDGRTSLSADLIVALIRSSALCDYFTLVDSTDVKATWKTRRAGGEERTLTWTSADAERADLLSKANWRRYPRQMMRARAAVELARLEYQEVVLGLYTPDELGDAQVIDAVAVTVVPAQDAPAVAAAAEASAPTPAETTAAPAAPATSTDESTPQDIDEAWAAEMIASDLAEALPEKHAAQARPFALTLAASLPAEERRKASDLFVALATSGPDKEKRRAVYESIAVFTSKMAGDHPVRRAYRELAVVAR